MMRFSRSTKRIGVPRALALLAIVALIAAACGDDGGGATATDDAAGDDTATDDTATDDAAGDDAATDDAATDDAAADDAAGDDAATDDAAGDDPLGEPNPATGTSVKVGLITNGGDCAECSDTGGDEEPTAEATVQWLNEYMGGLAGHPIELVICVDDLDAGKTVDCANQMIAEGVVAVVIGANGVIESTWNVLHEAVIPVINFSVTNTELIEDDQSTFILQDSESLTVDLPLGVAQDMGASMVSVIVVDLPIATDIYKGRTPQKFADAGLGFELFPVSLGTPDMTPQAQELVSSNPDGLVMITGHDAFCIPAINGLIAVGFTGTITTISHCVTDAMRDAFSADVLEGIVLAANSPLGDDEDPSMQQWNAVLDEYGDGSVDPLGATPLAIFSAFGALSVGTQDLEGEVTTDAVIAALRAMPNRILPGSGGRQFRCNGKASSFGAAICTASLLSATLDADGNPVSYTIINDDPIPD